MRTYRKCPQKEVKGKMKHDLKISISGQPEGNGIVRCRTVRLREKVLKRLFGEMHRITIIVPGSSVQTVSVQEMPEVVADDA